MTFQTWPPTSQIKGNQGFSSRPIFNLSHSSHFALNCSSEFPYVPDFEKKYYSRVKKKFWPTEIISLLSSFNGFSNCFLGVAH